MRLPWDDVLALQQLVDASPRLRVSPQRAERLLQLGYARETADGVVITRHGRSALEMNRRVRRHARAGRLVV